MNIFIKLVEWLAGEKDKKNNKNKKKILARKEENHKKG